MIVSFNLSKISVDKRNKMKGNVSVNSVVNINGINEVDIALKEKKALKVDFEYVVKYDPNIADILMKGYLIYASEDAKKMVDEWKKSKTISDIEVNSHIVNVILTRCSIKALGLAESMSLPLPVKLPKIVAEGQEKAEKGEAKDTSYVG